MNILCFYGMIEENYSRFCSFFLLFPSFQRAGLTEISLCVLSLHFLMNRKGTFGYEFSFDLLLFVLQHGFMNSIDDGAA